MLLRVLCCAAGTPALDSLEQNLSVGNESRAENAQETPVYERFNPLLHSGVKLTASRKNKKNSKERVLSIGFVKKYIQFAKTNIKPTLTKAAQDTIVRAYTGLRNDDLASNQKRVSFTSDDKLVRTSVMLETDLSRGSLVSNPDFSVDCSYTRNLDSFVNRSRQSTSVTHCRRKGRSGGRGDFEVRPVQRSCQASVKDEAEKDEHANWCTRFGF